MKRRGVLAAALCVSCVLLGGDRAVSQSANARERLHAPTAAQPQALAHAQIHAVAHTPAQAAASQAAAPQAHSGRLIVHLILHAVGEERYDLTPAADGLTLTTTMEYSDRGNTRKSSATLRMKADYTPLALDVASGTSTASATVQGTSATVDDSVAKRTFETPARYVSLFGASPFALQMTMMRYWLAHQRPAQLPMLSAGANAAPIEIVRAGRDVITIGGGRKVPLDRYTIRNLMFGQEILWMNAAGDLAAAMTFAGGLPMEAIRDEYVTALPDLYRSGVAQEMADLAAIGQAVPPERSGAFAIVGATLVDGTGAAPLHDSVVIVRQGRIDAVGARGTVPVPRGMAVIDAAGKTLLAGLWEMHTHFSGVEFGPALLAAGITTARDCGGEFDYLVAQRNAIESRAAVGPRLLLAGLVDAGAEKAFGHVFAETPDAGRAVVRRYHDAGFQQIKLYTFLTPDVVRAISEEAHRLGMTVTGHVPRALSPIEGVEAGMDQINHLSYVITAMRGPASAATAAPAPPAGTPPPPPIDIGSDVAQRAVTFFKDHQTVIDPTAGWGEMAAHAKGVEVASFEPGITHAPWIVETKFRGMGGTATPEQMHARVAQYLAVIGALHKAGVPIVPGSDTSLVGFGLHRELELYVEAGMTPLEAIQSATIVSARAMKLDREVGTVEQGKRADLILIDGDPLADIHNLRRVSRVISHGRVYDPAPLWKSVGFQP
jgi:imidazolonepropionase-like amidohydrolase